MKKIIILIAIVFICDVSYSQETTIPSKSRSVLPEAKDFSLSFDAVPFLNYFGNFFTDSNKSPEALFTRNHPMTITGLYLKSQDVAIRGKVRFGVGVEKYDTLVQRAGSTNLNEIVSNETKNTTSNITIGGGLQKWRGNERLRAFYGGELLLGISSDKTTYTYGNALSSENQDTRSLSYKKGNEYAFTLRGFVGVEYFFSRKMSVNAEFGWGPAIESIGRGKLVREFWDGGEVKQVITESGKYKKFTLDNDNAGGAINLNFYF